jgi:hypothetical protein
VPVLELAVSGSADGGIGSVRAEEFRHDKHIDFHQIWST